MQVDATVHESDAERDIRRALWKAGILSRDDWN